MTNNIITVGDKYDENLLSDTVTVTDRVWTGSEQSPEILKNCLMKIRYRQEPAIEAQLIHHNTTQLTFSIPETRGITAGQIAVAYTEDRRVL